MKKNTAVAATQDFSFLKDHGAGKRNGFDAYLRGALAREVVKQKGLKGEEAAIAVFRLKETLRCDNTMSQNLIQKMPSFCAKVKNAYESKLLKL